MLFLVPDCNAVLAFVHTVEHDVEVVWWCNRPTAVYSSSADNVAQSFYFATIRDPAQLGGQRRGSVCRIPSDSEGVSGPVMGETEPFLAVSLGPLLGQGGSGHVYRGTWNGATVAVKVCRHQIK